MKFMLKPISFNKEFQCTYIPTNTNDANWKNQSLNLMVKKFGIVILNFDPNFILGDEDYNKRKGVSYYAMRRGNYIKTLE